MLIPRKLLSRVSYSFPFNYLREIYYLLLRKSWSYIHLLERRLMNLLSLASKWVT